jgi:hypothetical protein
MVKLVRLRYLVFGLFGLFVLCLILGTRYLVSVWSGVFDCSLDRVRPPHVTGTVRACIERGTRISSSNRTNVLFCFVQI